MFLISISMLIFQCCEVLVAAEILQADVSKPAHAKAKLPEPNKAKLRSLLAT